MPDSDYPIAAGAAESVINDEIKAFVPPIFQSRIPAGAIHKMAAEIAKAVVDALDAAHGTGP